MAISTYSELKTAIADWMARSDVSGSAADFITLGEARLNRLLEVVATTTTDASGAQTQEQLPKTLLTLAVSQAEAERVLFASANGELAFGLLNNDSTVAASGGVNPSNLFR